MTSTTTTTIMDLRVMAIQGWNRESKSSGTELKNGEAKQAGGRGEGGGGKESESEAIHDSQVTLRGGSLEGKQHFVQRRGLEDLPQMAADIMSDKAGTQLEATTRFRKVRSNWNRPRAAAYSQQPLWWCGAGSCGWGAVTVGGGALSLKRVRSFASSGFIPTLSSFSRSSATPPYSK
jgi:hypothetical protein